MNWTRIVVSFMGNATSYMKSVNQVIQATTRMASSVIGDVAKMSSQVSGHVTKMASSMTATLGKAATGISGQFTRLAGQIVGSTGRLAQTVIRSGTSILRGGGGGMFGGMTAGRMLALGAGIGVATMAFQMLGNVAGQVFGNISNFIENGISHAITLGMEYERIQASFEVMTGSAEKGNALLAQVKKLAVESPYNSRGLINATEMSLGMGIDPEQVINVVGRIGDLAAGSEKKMQRLALAYGQVMSSGRFRGQELRQFTEVGIGVTDFAKTAGMGIREFKDQMAAGNISANVVVQTVNRLTEAGGRFNGMSKKINETVGGQWNSLKESIDMVLEQVAVKLFKAFDVAGILRSFTEGLSGVKSGVDGFVAGVQSVIPIWNEFQALFIAGYQTITEFFKGGSIFSDWIPTLNGLKGFVHGWIDWFLMAWEMVATTVATAMSLAAMAVGNAFVLISTGISMALKTFLTTAASAAKFLGKLDDSKTLQNMADQIDPEGFKKRMDKVNKALVDSPKTVFDFFKSARTQLQLTREEMERFQAVKDSFGKNRDAVGMMARVMGDTNSPFGIMVETAMRNGMKAAGINLPGERGALVPKIAESLETSLGAQMMADKLRKALEEGATPYFKFTKQLKDITEASAGAAPGMNMLIGGLGAGHFDPLINKEQRKLGIFNAFEDLQKAIPKEQNDQRGFAGQKGSAEAIEIIRNAARQKTVEEEVRDTLKRAELHQQKFAEYQEKIFNVLDKEIEAIVKKKV